MKKMMALMLALVMVFALAACGQQKAPAVGGWTPAEDAKMTDDAQSAFDKAMDGLIGVNYVPVALIGRQIVYNTARIRCVKQPSSFYIIRKLFSKIRQKFVLRLFTLQKKLYTIGS